MGIISKPQAVVFVCKIGDKYLAVSRKDNHQDFGFPGGKVESNETPKEAVVREVLEETGLKTFNENEIGICESDDGYYVHVFIGDILGGDIGSNENHIIKLCDWDEFLKGSFKNENEKIKAWVDEYYSQKSYDLHGLGKTASLDKSNDIKLWTAWKQDPSPTTLNPLMKQIEPIIKNEVNRWRQSTINPTLLEMEAKNLAFQSLHKYNPEKSQLNTHVTNNLKRLSRIVIDKQNIVRTPEEKIYEYRKFLKQKDDLENELGRTATALELDMHINNAGKIAQLKPMSEHFYSVDSEAGNVTQRDDLNSDPIAMSIMFDNLKDKQKLIFQHTYGYKGAPIYQNKEIAKMLNISAPAVTNHKKRIEVQLNNYKNSLDNLAKVKTGSYLPQIPNNVIEEDEKWKKIIYLN